MPPAAPSLSQLNRLREIGVVVARHGFGEWLDRTRLFESLGVEKPAANEDAEPAARGTGRRLRLALTELGPTFVKLGQVLSTRADMLPQDVVRELGELQDRVAPLPFADVKRVVEAGLGRPVSEAFSMFDETPLASASIAQVHRARTNGGIDVIVKVQRPGVRERMAGDLGALHALARLAESVFEESSLSSPVALVEELERALMWELEFTREAANLREFRTANEGRPYVVVPHVLDALSCDTVLTLEWLDGVKVTDAPEKDRAQAAAHLIELAFNGLFQDGLFHGDPHPGNLLLLAGNRIGLIDFGLIGRLTRPMQETLIVMCLAVSLRDAGTLARLLYKVGIPDERVSLSALAADIQALLDRYLKSDLREIDSRSLLGDLLDLARQWKIRIPRDYAVLAKAAITIEGVVRQLRPDLDVLEAALPYAKRLLYDRLNPQTREGGARRVLLQLQGLATDVPGQLAQVLMDLEGGKLNVTNRAQESQLQQVVAGLRLLVATVVCGAVGVGAAVLRGQPGVDASVANAALAGAVAAWLVSFGWLALGWRPRKLRLRRDPPARPPAR